MEQYNIWLDEVFLNTNGEDKMLLDLEICSNDINKTISLISSLTHSKKIDYTLVGQILFKSMEDKYFHESCNLYDLASRAHAVWNILPDDIARSEPFSTLCYIDEPLSYGDEKQTRKLFQKLFNYYKR